MKTYKKYINEAKGKIQVGFRVSPRRTKMRHYKDISQLSNDFNAEELKDANIDVLFNGVVVGNLNISSVISELF